MAGCDPAHNLLVPVNVCTSEGYGTWYGKERGKLSKVVFFWQKCLQVRGMVERNYQKCFFGKNVGNMLQNVAKASIKRKH